MLTTTAGELPSSEYSALIVDLKRYYLELRPALVRVYAVGLDERLNAAVLEPMGFTARGERRRRRRAAVQHLVARVRITERRRVAGATHRDRNDPVAGSGPARGRSACGDPMPEGARHLTAREREVLAALALGLTNRELAERLFISERTANRHLSNIFVKLGVRNRTEATRIAVAAGLA